ncbi:MAG: hypothetical protein RI883_1480 [Bacteroidota bacterium]|jgi:hypothetical protein
MKFKILLFTVLSTIFIGCSIQKRHYMPGFNVEWHKNYKNQAQDNLKSEEYGKPDDKLAQNSRYNKQPFEEQTNRDLKQGISSKNDVPKAIVHERMNNSNARNEANGVVNEIGTSKKIGNQQNYSDLKNESKAFSKENKENGDYLIYLSAVLMALGTVGGYQLGKKKLKNLTRWAKANPKKAQVLIAGMQLPLMGMSLYAGYNLEKMGYEISEIPGYIFGATSALGFLAVPFLPKKENFVLPRQMNRRKMAYLGVSLSSVMLFAGTGNHLTQNHPQSYATEVLASVDNSLFSDGSSIQVDSRQESHYQKQELTDKQLKTRAAVNAGLCIAAVLLFILLIVTLCAGICMIIFAFGGGVSGALLGFGGAIIAGLSIWGMYGIVTSGWCRDRDVE